MIGGTTMGSGFGHHQPNTRQNHALILLPSKRPQHHTTTNTNKAAHKQDEIVGGALLAVFLRHVICKDCEAKHSTRNHQKDFEKDVHGYSFVAVIVPKGIEPLSFAYQAKILPLKYRTTRRFLCFM